MNLSRFRLTNPRFVFSVACAPGLFGLMSWTAPPAAQNWRRSVKRKRR